jgi:hypothetical protein
MEDRRRIRIYKRSMRWLGYERSVLLLCAKKVWQVQKKPVKAAGGVSAPPATGRHYPAQDATKF